MTRAGPDKLEQRLREKHVNREIALQDSALRKLLKAEDGRRFLWWLLAEAETFQDPFTPNALEMSRACGKRYMGQLLHARILALDPDAFTTMVTENQQIEQAFNNTLKEQQRRTE